MTDRSDGVEETRTQSIAILNDAIQRVWTTHRLPAPPRHDQRGQILRDEHGDVVRDYSDQLASAITLARLTERLAKVVGSDAPVKYEYDSGVQEAAQAAADRVLARRPELREHLRAIAG